MSARVLPLPIYVGVEDVMQSLGVARSTAYELLRAAAQRAPGSRGLMRVSLTRWKAFCDSKFGADGPAANDTAPAERRRTPRPAPQKAAATVIPITRPRTRTR